MANDRDSFILSANKSKKKPGANPKWPDYRGEITIEGRTYELAGWIRTKRADGSKFLSGTVKAKEQKPAETAPGPQPGDQFDDDPPFG